MSVPEIFVKVFTDPMYAENGMVLHHADNHPCWIVDPGLPPQADSMIAYINAHHITPSDIILTHAHSDHIAGVDAVRNTHPDATLHLAKAEWALLTDPMQNLSAQFGANITASPDGVRDLAPGDVLELDGCEWTVLDTSGHSPGGRSLYCATLKLAIVGDAVFAGSIGRTDLHHSDHQRLLGNIHQHILSLPDDTTLLCGHGPATTVATERQNNPFLREPR